MSLGRTAGRTLLGTPSQLRWADPVCELVTVSPHILTILTIAIVANDISTRVGYKPGYSYRTTVIDLTHL